MPFAITAFVSNFCWAQCGGCAVLHRRVAGVVDGSDQPGNLRGGLTAMDDAL